MNKQLSIRKETPKKTACQKIICRSPSYRSSTLLAIKYKAYHGFTLVELLVVITIISILASMLLPVLSQARNMAKRTVCLSQMRQIGIALIYYAADHNDYLPAKHQPALNHSNPDYHYYAHFGINLQRAEFFDFDYGQFGRLLRGFGAKGRGAYIDSPEIFYCPAYTGTYCPEEFTPSIAREHFEKTCYGNRSNIVSSYSLNTRDRDDSTGGGPYSPLGGNERLSRCCSNNYIMMVDAWCFSMDIVHHGRRIPPGFNMFSFNGSGRWVNDSCRVLLRGDMSGPYENSIFKDSKVWEFRPGNLP